MEIAPEKTREEAENNEEAKKEEEGPTKAELQAKIESL